MVVVVVFEVVVADGCLNLMYKSLLVTKKNATNEKKTYLRPKGLFFVLPGAVFSLVVFVAMWWWTASW